MDESDKNGAVQQESPDSQEKVSPEETQKPEGRKRKKGARSPRPFPICSLDESLLIARALKEYNGGNPWQPSEVTRVLKYGVGNKWFYLTASSRDYGLTVGTREAEKIELAETGKQIVYARSKTEEATALKKAFLNVPLFKAVYDYYSGGNLPEIEYLKNTLKVQFGLDEEHHEDFYKIYQANLRYLKDQGILVEAKPTVEAQEGGSTSHAITVGEPALKSSLTVFVAMPFNEKTDKYPAGFFDEVLKHLITPSSVKAGFKVETARKQGSDVIQSTIINDLINADLVITDLTEHNPNVLFELGMRIAVDKPVALIRAKGTAPIFDVDHMLRVYDYDPCLWKSTLEVDIPALAEHVKASWENRDKDKSYLKILKGS